MRRVIIGLIEGLLLCLACDALVANNNDVSRRRFLTIPALAFTNVVLLPNQRSNALDFDAFIEKELAADVAKSVKKPLSNDEALCAYGQPGKERGDACVRAGIPIATGGKKVNAYGEVDRGTYVRCKQFYELEEEGYVKKTFCE